MEELLREATEARCELAQMLQVTAEALQQMAAIGTALAAAVEKETICTRNYVSALEQIVSAYQGGTVLN
jgi:hypothetical protein